MRGCAPARPRPRSASSAPAIAFAKRGVRRKAGYGLSYDSRCGRFRLYHGDQCGGVALRPARWLAIALDPPRVLSRHRTRAAAAQACRRCARAAGRGTP